ncbi:MAG TPA: phosphoenolpyruvate--protein phosphotransferase, partial [Ruminococcaceae bacterium]|nr:phosphoenolpyruvate--protein phosphotransferase [Oscillospiraceae bacterium]
NSLNKVYLQSLKRLGEKDSMIFQIHMMMLQDEDYTNSILDKIRQENVNAEYAVQETGKEFAERFAQMDSEYMRGRKADVIDISRRLIQCLAQKDGTKFCLDEPSIIAADDLTPSETMQLEKSKVLAILTRNGSRTAHSAILSRTMGIPSVVNLGDDFQKLRDGMNVIVNGTSGDVLLEPDEAAQNTYQQSREEYVRNRNELKQLLGKKIVTRDGRVMSVNANIGRPTDAEAALENGADGIGLFRSEFLYMERDSLPSEDEQFHAYQQVLQKMGDKPVIIRTFDIGADKQLPYLDLPQEQNPALGYRAIRICLDRTELFKTQLRALFRASAFGNLKIMFPMIISVEEVRKAKAMI